MVAGAELPSICSYCCAQSALFIAAAWRLAKCSCFAIITRLSRHDDLELSGADWSIRALRSRKESTHGKTEAD